MKPIALLFALALAGTAAAADKNWLMSDGKDPMTGALNVMAFTNAKHAIPNTIGRPVYPSLVVRCARNKTELYVDWGRFITVGDIYGNGTRVLTRLDEQKPVAADWQMSTNYQATFARNPVALLRLMKGKTMLRAEVVPHGSSPVLAEFDLAGLDDVVAKVSKQCNWPSSGDKKGH